MKKIIICYFSSIGSLLVFMLAINMNQILLAVIMFALFTICLLWFSEITQKKKKHSRSAQVGKEQETYRIDIPIDDVGKKQEAGNVRPGSRPSDTYLKMVGGDEIDSRTENQATAT